VTGSCEDSNENLGSIKGEEFRDCVMTIDF
jgi:hypothetical protein